MSKRKHADLWKKLVDEAGEDEIDRAASVSVEQAEADLKAAGFDVAAERAKANAFLDALENGAPRSAPGVAPQVTPIAARAADEKRRARPRPPVAWLAAAATLGGVAGGALVAALQPPALVATRSPPASSTSAPVVPSVADLVAAADLRGQATAACDAKQWSVCLADLDMARAADPGGDDAPAVKSLRDRAIAEILQKPAHRVGGP
jgi:hypothetical protein